MHSLPSVPPTPLCMIFGANGSQPWTTNSTLSRRPPCIPKMIWVHRLPVYHRLCNSKRPGPHPIILDLTITHDETGFRRSSWYNDRRKAQLRPGNIPKRCWILFFPVEQGWTTATYLQPSLQYFWRPRPSVHPALELVEDRITNRMRTWTQER